MYAPQCARWLDRRLLTALYVCLALTLGCAADSALAQGEKPTAAHRQVQFETCASFGNLHLFAYDDSRAVHPVGVEYDRHWVRSVLKGNLESVSGMLPVLIVSEPARYNAETGALITRHKDRRGVGFAPAGARLIWRSSGLLQPYLGGKAGVAWFRNPLVPGKSTRLHFISEFSAGVERTLSNRWGFRAGFSDFHMANAGLGSRKSADFIYFNGGLSYRF